MSKGYVEELALRYYQKKGFLVTQNIPFQLDKEKTGLRVAGWSDIDLLAVDQAKMLIIQCKSFLGTGKAEKVADHLEKWFSYAENYIREDQNWKVWLNGRELCNIVVVDCHTPKTEELLEEKGIVIVRYSEIVKELFRKLADPGKYVKEDDIILRFMSALVYSGIVDPKQFKKNE